MSRQDRRRERRQQPLDPHAESKQILNEQGLGAHELPVPNGPDSTPTEPAATESKRTPDPARDQPTPTDEEYARARGIPTEDEYVAKELTITKRLIERGLKDADGLRLRRSEEYLRWRYAAFLRGEVASL